MATASRSEWDLRFENTCNFEISIWAKAPNAAPDRNRRLGIGVGDGGFPAGGAGCAVSLCRRRVDVLTEPTGGPFSRGRRGPFFSCHFQPARLLGARARPGSVTANLAGPGPGPGADDVSPAATGTPRCASATCDLDLALDLPGRRGQPRPYSPHEDPRASRRGQWEALPPPACWKPAGVVSASSRRRRRPLGRLRPPAPRRCRRRARAS